MGFELVDLFALDPFNDAGSAGNNALDGRMGRVVEVAAGAGEKVGMEGIVVVVDEDKA